MHRARKWAVVILGAYLLTGTMIYFIQEKFIFLPSSLPVDYQYDFEVPFEEIFLETSDDARLNGLHFKSSSPRGVILYFHGNAGTLARWGEIAMSLTKEYNYDVVVMDYRTYGKSKGQLSEKALYEDGQLFYDYILQLYKEQEVVLFGRSLGTGIATLLASTNSPGQLILETPYYSMLDLGQKRFPYLPVKWLLRYEFKSFEYVQNIACPVTVFHGTRDEIVPLESGRKLFETIPGSDKEMIIVEGGRHNNLSAFDSYNLGLRDVLEINSIEKVR